MLLLLLLVLFAAGVAGVAVAVDSAGVFLRLFRFVAIFADM